MKWITFAQATELANRTRSMNMRVKLKQERDLIRLNYSRPSRPIRFFLLERHLSPFLSDLSTGTEQSLPQNDDQWSQIILIRRPCPALIYVACQNG